MTGGVAKSRYDYDKELVCIQCNSKMIASNRNQKYCASCTMDRMKQRKDASNARARARRLAAKAAINGPENHK